MQTSKEWIKECITTLRRQAGFPFNHDLFISILLCLISDQDRHLILTAPPDRLAEVAQMAILVASGVFGFSTAGHVCQPNQTADDLFRALLSTDPNISQPRDLSKNSERYLHRPSRSSQAASLHSFTADSPRNSSLKEDIHDDQQSVSLQHRPPPISPIDFSLRSKRNRDPYAGRNSYIPRDVAGSIFGRHSNRSRWSEHEDSLRLTNRLAQTWVIQGLDTSNDLIQAALLELMITKELQISNTKYKVPKSHFLVIVVLPHNHSGDNISSHLLDRFFINYRFREEMIDAIVSSSYPLPASRRVALMRNEGKGGIKELAAKAAKIYVNIEITRYIRDIVVAIRAHPCIQGGLTARASQDLMCVTKCLAAIYGQEYLTPDLVLIAVEKVLSHRVAVVTPGDGITDSLDNHNRRDFSAVLKEVLEAVYAPL